MSEQTLEPSQVIWCLSASEMLDKLEGLRPKATLIMADPPWAYRNRGKGVHGAASSQYEGVSLELITNDMIKALEVCELDAYMLVWCTWPKLVEWTTYSTERLHNARPKAKPIEQRGWRYVSGGCWAKDGMGVGIHWRGDCEPALLYTLGHPQPRTTASNLWKAPKIGHSEKPQLALRRQVAMMTDPGDLVVDLYAGQSASLARACRALGRSYVGAELDPERYEKALRALSQQEMPGELYPMEKPKRKRAQATTVPVRGAQIVGRGGAK